MKDNGFTHPASLLCSMDTFRGADTLSQVSDGKPLVFWHGIGSSEAIQVDMLCAVWLFSSLSYAPSCMNINRLRSEHAN